MTNPYDFVHTENLLYDQHDYLPEAVEDAFARTLTPEQASRKGVSNE